MSGFGPGSPPPPPPPGGFGPPPPPGGFGAPPPASQPPPGWGPPPPPPPGYYGRPAWAPAPAPSRASPIRIIVIFVVVLLGVAVLAGVVIALSAPPPPVAPCAPGVPCAPIPTFPPIAGSPLPVGTPRPPSTPAPVASPGASLAPVGTPTSDSPPVVGGTLYTDDSLGYSFEYDGSLFSLGNHGPGTAVLEGNGIDTVVWVDAKTAETSPAKLIEAELADVDGFMIARETDTDTYDAVLGPSIGYVPGEGGVWAGTLVSSDGTPIEPGGVTAVAATDGRITVAVVVIVGSPDHLVTSDDTQQHGVRSLVDQVLKTFNWNAQ